MKMLFVFIYFFSQTTFAQANKVDGDFLLNKIKDDPTILSLIASIQDETPRADLEPEHQGASSGETICSEIKLTSDVVNDLMMYPHGTYWVGFTFKCSHTYKGQRRGSDRFCGSYKYSEYKDKGYPLEISIYKNEDCTDVHQK